MREGRGREEEGKGKGDERESGKGVGKNRKGETNFRGKQGAGGWGIGSEDTMLYLLKGECKASDIIFIIRLKSKKRK